MIALNFAQKMLRHFLKVLFQHHEISRCLDISADVVEGNNTLKVKTSIKYSIETSTKALKLLTCTFFVNA